MGHLQGRAVPDVPRSDLRAQFRANRAQDRAGDVRPAVLRSPALGNCRYDDQQLRGGREEPKVVPFSGYAVRGSVSPVPDPVAPDRVEQGRRDKHAAAEPRVGTVARHRRLIANACRESPWFATSTAFPVGVLISASPVTSSGARKPLSTAATGVKWPCPSPLSHNPLPASARGVFGSASYRLTATIRSRLPSPSTSSTAIPLIGEICARLGSDDRVNVPSPVFCR